MFLIYRTEVKASEISFICIHHMHDAILTWRVITRIWSFLCIYFVTFSLSHLLLLLTDNFSVCLPLSHFPGPGLISYAFIPLLDLPFLISFIFCTCLQYFLFLYEFRCSVQFPFTLCAYMNSILLLPFLLLAFLFR